MMVLILFILILATFLSSTTMNILQIMEKHEANKPIFSFNSYCWTVSSN